MIEISSKAKQLAAYIQKNPNDSFSKFALALEFLKADQPDKARILFENIRNNDPGYVGVYYHLGHLYERMGRLNDALTAYEQGIRVASDQQDERSKIELKEVLAELKFEME
jgi:Tfp pilus assembly protein PilF